MAENNNFKGTVEALFHGMDGVVSSKTVVGDAIHIGDTIILPLVDVSFAYAKVIRDKRKIQPGIGDDAKRRACSSEWAYQACEYQESGYDDQDP